MPKLLRNPISEATNGTQQKDIAMHQSKCISTIGKTMPEPPLLITGHWYHERILCRWLCLCVYGSLKNTSLNAHIFLLNNIFPKFLTSIFLSLFPYHYYFLRHLIHTHIFFITYSRCALGEFYEKVFFVFDFLFCKLNYPPLTENCI